ncbi:MAG: tRNA (N6-threonylcarbamoyladenosine(37)-N6)-methyltransferase TrmO [Candidatus Verstraetearchaeota archaeon]|nr:tRNA (N6-threonylcarbamoyladenosine(37)-N6)-methyltransferase TrmO [Candidatus Verstraetearchaeota archaeon]
MEDECNAKCSAFNLKPIGFVRTRHRDDEISESFEGVDGTIEILDDFSAGLEGLEGFSHILVVAYLHKIPLDARKAMMVKPKWLVKYAEDPRSIPEVGVFATRSPHRPNPIALSVVRLIEREGKNLKVDDLDLYDGTPVLDLKPYIPLNCCVRFPAWFLEMQKKVRDTKGKELTF